MIEEPRLILPSEEQCDNITKDSQLFPLTNLAPVIPEAPHDTPNPPSIPIHESIEYPTVYESPTLTEGNTKDIAIPGPAPVEPQIFRRSTREKKRSDYYVKWVKESLSVFFAHIFWIWIIGSIATYYLELAGTTV